MAEPKNIFQQMAEFGKANRVFNQNSWAARMWFRAQVQKMSDITPDKVVKSSKPWDRLPAGTTASQPMYGKMLMYWYKDPVTKKKLPYYDQFPVIFLIGPAKPGKNGAGFYGLNMHYLPPFLRAKLFDALWNTKGFLKNQGEPDQRILMTYAKLMNNVSQLKAFKPCFKHYLYSQVKQLVVVPPTEWDKVLFLPLAQWKRGGGRLNGVKGPKSAAGPISEKRVHADSIRKIG